MGGVAWLAVAVAAGCSSAKPPAAVLHVPAKPKHPVSWQDDRAEEPGTDDGFVYGGPETQRKNLPLAGTRWGLGLGQFDGFGGEEAHYRLEFKPNGWFDAQADCRHAAGIYEADGQRIALAVIKASHAACHKSSRAQDFFNALEAAKTFRQADGRLYLDLKRGVDKLADDKPRPDLDAAAKTLVFDLKP